MIKDSQINTTVYEETLTGRPHDTSVQKPPVTNKIWMQFNVMLWTSLANFVFKWLLDSQYPAGYRISGSSL